MDYYNYKKKGIIKVDCLKLRTKEGKFKRSVTYNVTHIEKDFNKDIILLVASEGDLKDNMILDFGCSYHMSLNRD